MHPLGKYHQKLPVPISQLSSRPIQVIKTDAAPAPTQVGMDDLAEERLSVPVVCFVNAQANTETEGDAEKTPSERSASISSGYADATKAVNAESTTTAPLLITLIAILQRAWFQASLPVTS